jgi:hypothetical protein
MESPYKGVQFNPHPYSINPSIDAFLPASSLEDTVMQRRNTEENLKPSSKVIMSSSALFGHDRIFEQTAEIEQPQLPRERSISLSELKRMAQYRLKNPQNERRMASKFPSIGPLPHLRGPSLPQAELNLRTPSPPPKQPLQLHSPPGIFHRPTRSLAGRTHKKQESATPATPFLREEQIIAENKQLKHSIDQLRQLNLVESPHPRIAKLHPQKLNIFIINDYHARSTKAGYTRKKDGAFFQH